MDIAIIGCGAVGTSNLGQDIWLPGRTDVRRKLVSRDGLRGQVVAGADLGNSADRLTWVWGTCACIPTGLSEDLSF